MRTPIRLLAIPAVTALALLAACGSESADSPTATTALSASTTAAPTTAAAGPTTTGAEQPVTGDQFEITLKVGVDDSPTRVEHVPLGASVVIAMQSDADEEYHLHDYDLEEKAAAGVEVVWEFTADNPGTFELESHTTDDVLLVLQVA